MKNNINRKFRQISVYTLKFGVAFGLVAYLLYTGKLDIHAIYGATDNYGYLVAAFFCVLAAIMINFFRWFLLLRGQDINLSAREVISLNFIGLFFTTVLPGAVGGDLVKSVYIARKAPDKKTAAVLTVLLDRVVGLIALIIIGCAGLTVNFKNFYDNPALKTLGITLYIVLLGLGIFFIAGLSRRIYRHRITLIIFRTLPFSEAINKVYAAFHAYRYRPRILLYSIIISFVTHAFNIWSFYFITLALGFEHLSVYTYFFIVPVGMITTALPVAPAGIGIGQAAYLKLFEWSVGSPTTVGADAITILQIFSICIFLCGGFFYITYKNRMNPD
ncbi:MAG: flippase-like domain-containing protein, partial [Oligoflexia bacterium]|nr:flippase-like domain-containing protein [Oligoflexia bacterium]